MELARHNLATLVYSVERVGCAGYILGTVPAKAQFAMESQVVLCPASRRLPLRC